MEDKKLEIMDYIAKKPRKFTLKIQSMFNKMDMRCRQMAMTNPNRPMSDYCHKCQELFKKTLGDE